MTWSARQQPVAFAAAVALLCLPAIWNGFPLLFDDVGGYLERWPTRTLGNGRSAAYGLLLSVTASSWWMPVVLLQSGVTVWVVARAMAVAGLDCSPWILPCTVAAIAATSGAAFFASQAMPDAWAAPAVLGFLVLAWYADRLTTMDRAILTGIIAFAGASHMATLGVLAGLSLLHVVAWSLPARFGVAPIGALRANLAAWSGLALLFVVNLQVGGDVALTPGGRLFVFGRLVESGIVGKALNAECPRDDWALCAFRDDMPVTTGDFLWDGDSPLYKMGGWNDPRLGREVASITRHSLQALTADHLVHAVASTVAQFMAMGAPDSMGRVESWHNVWIMEQRAPWLVAPYANSRQQRDEIDLRAWGGWVVMPVSLAGIIALPFAAIWLWRLGGRREAMLLTMVLLALLGNAALCGVASGPHARYQARLVWLAPFVVALALPAARQRWKVARGIGVPVAQAI